MSLPLLHAGRTNPGLSAALDLRFALDKSLTAYRGPTPSFSRASTGSYFDESGVLRYAALNLNLYSEQFDNAAYTKNQGAVSANQTTAPDGKITADSFTASAGTVNPHAYQAVTTVNGSVYTFSIYVKKNTHDFVQIVLNGVANGFANFDINNGVLGTLGAGGSATSSIVNVGNGWYRCVVSYTTASTSGNGFINLIGSATAGRGATFTAAGTESVYLWGQQLELSSTVGTYCPTTSSANSAPRFNHTYNGTSWVSRGLLVEEQRTNALQYSESFNTSPYWAAAGGATITANQAVAPDGNTTADNVAGVNGFYQNSAGMGSSTATNTASIFAKANGSSSITLRINEWGSGINYVEGTFNLSNGTATATNAGSGSGATASTIDCGNGWYRCIITGKPSTTAGTCGFYPYGMTASVYCWGAQFEAGASFATSYIPSLSNSSTTRSADVCQITGSDFSGFYNQNEGSVVLEFDGAQPLPSPSPRNFPAYLSISKGNSGYDLETNSFSIFGNSDTNKIGAYASIDRVTQYEIYSTGLFLPNLPQRSSFGYAVNNFGFTNNGENVLTDTSGTNPSQMAYLHLGKSSVGTFSCHIARLRYFNKRLPNATLQLLSEPDPTLNLQFALNKSLTPFAGPAPSFSRASTGTYFNASGVLTSASINTPRFDHVLSGGQWVSRGLLVEEQRTNGLLQSNGYGNSPWTIASSRGTVTQNAASPDGTNNAWTGNCTVTAPGGFYLIQGGLSSPSATYTLSFFAKKDNNGFVAIEAGETSNDVYVFFDLTNGLSGNLSSVGGYTNISHGLSDCGNGWYRCRLTFTKSNSNNLTAYIYPTCNSFSSLSCTSGQTNFIFGAQYETGSFATSYIPTTTSSVTRSADVCQITGTSFNWMWNQGEGSVVAEWDARRNSGGQFTVYWARDAASSNTVLHTGREALSPPGVRFSVVSSASVSAEIINAGFPDPGVLTKTAGCYKANDFAYAYNGALVGTDASGAVPINPTDIMIGYDPYSNYLNGHISKLIYYPARLTNTKLQQLST